MNHREGIKHVAREALSGLWEGFWLACKAIGLLVILITLYGKLTS